MNSSYLSIDRINYVASIDPIYSYQRCYKHIAMGVANDYYVQHHSRVNTPHERLFDEAVVIFHTRLHHQMQASIEVHIKSRAYQKAKKLIFERMAKLFRNEDTPSAKDMVFKVELILATQFSARTGDKRGGGST